MVYINNKRVLLREQPLAPYEGKRQQVHIHTSFLGVSVDTMKWDTTFSVLTSSTVTAIMMPGVPSDTLAMQQKKVVKKAYQKRYQLKSKGAFRSILF